MFQGELGLVLLSFEMLLNHTSVGSDERSAQKSPARSPRLESANGVLPLKPQGWFQAPTRAEDDEGSSSFGLAAHAERGSPCPSGGRAAPVETPCRGVYGVVGTAGRTLLSRERRDAAFPTRSAGVSCSRSFQPSRRERRNKPGRTQSCCNLVRLSPCDSCPHSPSPAPHHNPPSFFMQPIPS